MLFFIHKSLFLSIWERLFSEEDNQIAYQKGIFSQFLYHWWKSSLKILFFVHDKIEFIAKATPVLCKNNLVYSNMHIYEMCISQTKR